MQKRVLYHLHGETFARRYQVASQAITSAASGHAVWVVLHFDALRRWVEGGFDTPTPGEDEEVAARLAKLGLPSPKAMLEEARQLGLRVVACETAAELAGVRPDDARPHLDDMPGLAEIQAFATGAALVLYV